MYLEIYLQPTLAGTASTVLDAKGGSNDPAVFTGNVTGNCSGTAATVTVAAQSNITSLGALTGLNFNKDEQSNHKD